jgi:hypothetical protein
MRTATVASMLVATLAVPVPTQGAADAEDARVLGSVLVLLREFVRAAAEAGDAQEARRRADELLAGRNAEANRAAAELVKELVAELPAAQRALVVEIARDLLAIARRERARAPEEAARERAIAARKELHAMGLRYWDEAQYREALARGDRIAVELFHAARGLPGGPR